MKFDSRLIIIGLCLLLPLLMIQAAGDDCEKCGPTRLIGCRKGRCYYKCIRRCLDQNNKFYYEALKFNFAGQR